MGSIIVPTHYYQQFDADYTLDVPGEGYGGWKKTDLPISLQNTAVVVMHAWDVGPRETYPGWYRAVEYIPRSYGISREVFPGLLRAVRQSGMCLFHVAGGNESYYNRYPGYAIAESLAGDEPGPPEQIDWDPVLEQMHVFRTENVFPGAHNQRDIANGAPHVRFLKEAEPQGEERIAATSRQLYALCREEGINHLIYTGFAINWCLLLSPGGISDMSKHGIMCSAVRQAVTAVENKETARRQLNKELGLWRVALAYGFVYDADDLIDALQSKRYEENNGMA